MITACCSARSAALLVAGISMSCTPRKVHNAPNSSSRTAQRFAVRSCRGRLAQAALGCTAQRPQLGPSSQVVVFFEATVVDGDHLARGLR
jgi:hypothetical protein